ncbi:hypothetical protein C2845_PM15G03330 [Panicum miliaceum]|uniref:Uncharacterized protein n=1 Tax=Panicum miliaceum TaxID=4540 RepID=A0A3L6QBK7_PANMI|nr:hypothetical protein C2845_PM15G03330 [Panicum miliaceum]
MMPKLRVLRALAPAPSRPREQKALARRMLAPWVPQELVMPYGWQHTIAADLIDDPYLTAEKKKQIKGVFKDLYEFTTNLMDRSQEKSEKLKFIEDGHRKHIREEIQKRLDLHNELDQLKKERTQETWRFKSEIRNLEKENAELVEKNKKISKAYKELKSTLQKKENMIIDLKNLVYHGADDVKRLEKVVQDTSVQFHDAMQEIKNMLEEKDVIQKELEEFKTAAQSIVEMVEFPVVGEAGELSLLEKLRAIPQKVASYISEATRMIYKKELVNEGCPNAEKTLEKQFSPWFKKHPVSEDGVQVDASVVDDLRGQREAEMQQDESGDGEDETIWQYMSDNEDLPIGIPTEDDDDSDYEYI